MSNGKVEVLEKGIERSVPPHALEFAALPTSNERAAAAALFVRGCLRFIPASGVNDVQHDRQSIT